MKIKKPVSQKRLQVFFDAVFLFCHHDPVLYYGI